MIGIHDPASGIVFAVRIIGAMGAAMMAGESVYLTARLVRRIMVDTHRDLVPMWRAASVLVASMGVMAVGVMLSRFGRIVADAPFTYLDLLGLAAAIGGVWSLYALARLDAHWVSSEGE